MGTWGIGSFENDSALDWLADLTESDDLSVLEQALELESGDDDDDDEAEADAGEDGDGDYLDADYGVEIIAAGEIIAALLGRPVADLPEDAADWVKSRPAGDVETLRAKVLGLLPRVLAESSELRDLWSENEEKFPGWRGRVDDLIARLQR